MINITTGLLRAAGIGAVAVLASSILSLGTAGADTFVPLPGGELTETLVDGTVVTVRTAAESATIGPSVGGTPLHRNAWVSGTAQVQLAGRNLKGGSISPGYVVGCQVDISGGGVNGGAGASTDFEGQRPDLSNSGGAQLTLGPGQARSFFLLDIERPNDYGDESHKKFTIFRGPNGSVTWSDSTIELTGCGGYAQARSFVRVKVETAGVLTWVTLWGQPFSLG
ncbi:MspA family porin [Nocardia sp. NPDC003963]